MDVIWGYLRAKLPLLSRIALCVLVVPHRNAGEERIFSMITKNKTNFQSHLQLRGSLNSVTRIKKSVPESLTVCHKWKPSPSLLKVCKQATEAYNEIKMMDKLSRKYILKRFWTQKNQNFKKMKKTPEDIIILHMCIKNFDHMMYSSWDMACYRPMEKVTVV